MGSLRRSFACVKCTTVVDCGRLRTDTVAHDMHHDDIVVVIDGEIVDPVATSDNIKIGLNCGSECQCLGCCRCTMLVNGRLCNSGSRECDE